MPKLIPNKIFTFLAIFLASCCAGTTLQAQVLFDNGPYFNNTGGGASGANASVLYTTTFGMGTIGFGHQSNLFNRVADDFTISDCHWRIDSIVFFGYQTGSTTTSTFTGVNFRIWDSIPDAVGSSVVYGDTTTNRMTRSVWSGTYRVSETTLTATTRPIMRNVCTVNNLILPTGTFWIDWASTGSLGSGPWAPPRTPVNVAITGNGRQRIGSTWNNLVDGGTGTPAQGLPFIIYGTVLDPVADAGPDQSGCLGDAFALGGTPSGSGGQGTLTYSWTPGATLSDSSLANPMAAPSATSMYTLAVTDSTGCTVLDTVTISLGAVLSQFLIADTTICSYDTISLDAGAGVSYLWSSGDTTRTINVGPGTYAVSVDDGSGCPSSDTVSVQTAPGVVITGNGTFCAQQGDTLTASLSPAVYNWNTGQNTQAIIVTQSGTYFVDVIDSFGCNSVDTFAVVALPLPTAAFSSSVGGSGLDYSFSDQSTGNPTLYSWSFGDGGTSTAANPTHTYAHDSTYLVTLIVTNSCGADTETVLLTVVALQEGLHSGSVTLSPNPARGQFKFEVSGFEGGALQVEMMDIQGRICQTWSLETNGQSVVQRVDAERLAKGLYILRFKSSNFVEARKIVLE